MSIKKGDLEYMLLHKSEEAKAIPFSLLAEITNGFSDELEIGRGGFAIVYKGTLDNGYVAVKRLTNTYMYETEFHREVECLVKVKHRNIVRFLGYCADTQGNVGNYEGKFVMANVEERLLCFEYVPNGSLHDYIKDASCGLEWRTRYAIIKDICEGLLYLHQNNIWHLDLKPGNILLDSNMVAKITDFGLSRCFGEDESKIIATKVSGTMGYLAPEFTSHVVTHKFDLYSLGCIIMEILTGKKGYEDIENVRLVVLESWSSRLEISRDNRVREQIKVCAEIGMECTEFNPWKRPSTMKHIMDRLVQTECGKVETEDEEVIDFLSKQDKNQYRSPVTGSSSPCLVPDLNFEAQSQALRSGTRNEDEEPTTAPQNSGRAPQRVQLVIKSNKAAPLQENKQTVMLELTGGDCTSDRPSLDLVVIIEVWRRRMKEVKTAMRFVLQMLGPLDRLSVVSCDPVDELCPLREITEIARRELLDLITAGIKSPEMGDYIRDGLLIGLKVLADRDDSAGRVAAIMIVCDKKRYQGDASKVIVRNVPVYTFGYNGEEHTVLRDVASNSLGGTFSHVHETGGALTMAFGHCLAGLFTVSAQDLELTVAPVEDQSRIVKTSAGSYPQTLDDDDGSVTIRFGNLYSGEVRKVVVDLSLGACNVDQDLEFLKLTYSYSNSNSSSSSSSGGRERFVRRLKVWRTTPSDGLEVEEENRDVDVEKARQQVVDLIQQALQQQGWLSQLKMAKEALKMDVVQDPILTGELHTINHLIVSTLETNAYADSFVSSHNRQRSTVRSTSTEIMRVFGTSSMLACIDQAMEFYHHEKEIQEPDESDKKSGLAWLWPWGRRA